MNFENYTLKSMKELIEKGIKAKGLAVDLYLAEKRNNTIELQKI